MKPINLGNIPVTESLLEQGDFDKDSIHRVFKNTYPGEICPRYLEAKNSLLSTLTNFLKSKGYRYNPCDLYVDKGVLPLVGSVGMHTDEGLGLMASWLVFDEEPAEGNGEAPELVTNGFGHLKVHTGDIFIFDSEIDHGWISNNNCLLIQSSVCPI